MSERYISRGALISTALILGLGAVGCSGTESNTNDRKTGVEITAHCKRANMDRTVEWSLSLLTSGSAPQLRQHFEQQGISAPYVESLGATCDQRLTSQEIMSGTHFVSVKGFSKPCLPIMNVISDQAGKKDNMMFVICPTT